LNVAGASGYEEIESLRARPLTGFDEGVTASVVGGGAASQDIADRRGRQQRAPGSVCDRECQPVKH
jgi:hypothetical protein